MGVGFVVCGVWCGRVLWIGYLGGFVVAIELGLGVVIGWFGCVDDICD